MKKHILSILVVMGLTACSSGTYNTTAVEKRADLKQVCVTGDMRKAPEDLPEAVVESLKKKGIRAEVVRSSKLDDANCTYAVKFNARGNKQVIARANVSVVDLNTKAVLGLTGYKRRGDETERTLQGQTDYIINELFKNY